MLFGTVISVLGLRVTVIVMVRTAFHDRFVFSVKAFATLVKRHSPLWCIAGGKRRRTVVHQLARTRLPEGGQPEPSSGQPLAGDGAIAPATRPFG
jgi:hypothetical protein